MNQIEDSRLIAIRWTWWPEEEDQAYSYLPAKEFLERERDYEGESSCEVERKGGLWWACPDSFGLVLDPSYPIRKVWGTDVHTFSENGLLIPGDWCEGDEEEERLEANGWEEANQKFLEWRPTPESKIWWAEGTWPGAKGKVVAFALTRVISTSCRKMWEVAREVFGDLPVLVVDAHPDANAD